MLRSSSFQSAFGESCLQQTFPTPRRGGGALLGGRGSTQGLGSQPSQAGGVVWHSV